MAYTTADVDALQRALALGVRRVRYPDGSEIEYRSLTEMQQQLTNMQAEISGRTKAGRAVLVRF